MYAEQMCHRQNYKHIHTLTLPIHVHSLCGCVCVSVCLTSHQRAHRQYIKYSALVVHTLHTCDGEHICKKSRRSVVCLSRFVLIFSVLIFPLLFARAQHKEFI